MQFNRRLVRFLFLLNHLHSPVQICCQMAGEDVMKEFTDQQTKMQEEMGDASDPMAMFKKILSGEGMDEPKPAAAPAAVASSGATAKRSKKQRD